MNIIPGMGITIRHYSLINVVKGIVSDVQNDSVTIKLPKEGKNIFFSKGDPLVVAYEVGDSVEIIGGRLISFSPEMDQLTFLADQPDKEQKMRSYVRYPVSVYADFRLTTGGRKFFALVKDISEYGLMIYTPESFNKGQRFDFDIYLTRDVLSLTAEIIRKTENEGYFEYGLQIIHTGPIVFNHIKSFIKKTQEEHAIKLNKPTQADMINELPDFRGSR